MRAPVLSSMPAEWNAANLRDGEGAENYSDCSLTYDCANCGAGCIGCDVRVHPEARPIYPDAEGHAVVSCIDCNAPARVLV